MVFTKALSGQNLVAAHHRGKGLVLTIALVVSTAARAGSAPHHHHLQDDIETSNFPNRKLRRIQEGLNLWTAKEKRSIEEGIIHNLIYEAEHFEVRVLQGEGNSTEDHDHDHNHEDEDHDHSNHVAESSEVHIHEGEDHSTEGHDHDHNHENEDHDHSTHDDSTHNHSHEFASSESAEGNAKPWGTVIGATVLVNIVTLSGLLLVVFPWIYSGVLKLKGAGQVTTTQGLHGRGKFIDIVLPGFAAGALLATTVFLVLPEALHMIGGEHDHSHEHNHRFLQEDDHSEHGVLSAKFGCSLLGGFLLPFVLNIIFHIDVSDCNDQSAVSGEAANKIQWQSSESASELDADAETAVQVTETKIHDSQVEIGDAQDLKPSIQMPVANTRYDYSLGASILVGDFFHNFADGLFIGAAFLSCSSATAWTVTAGTIYHELAQEISDFIILTHFVGLSVFQACILNFLSGISVVLGGITIMLLEPSDQTIGIVLAVAAGVYLNISASETVPRIERAVKDRMDRVWALFSFIVGTVPIGLVLLDHQHCG